MESAISLSNAAKKRSLEHNDLQKLPKKLKNLRYFLKKKRGIIYKHAPSSTLFARARENTTAFDNTSKSILWAVELLFIQLSPQQSATLNLV